MAQDNQTECSIGSYQPLTGEGGCDGSDAGYYVDQTAQSNQSECGFGTYQPLTGQGNCDDADAGYYVDQMAQSNQTECSIGTYQISTGQDSCDDADAGHYVPIPAQANQTECSIGTYQTWTRQGICDDADAGHYVAQPIQTNQTECSIGTYQSLTGQSNCDDADAGYYVSIPAQANQMECSIGAYQALKGQISCDYADAGYFVELAGQIIQTPCDFGSYQGLVGQSTCIEADIGYYVDSSGAKLARHCPDFKSTISNSSVSETDCLTDTDSDSLPDIIDDDDDDDGYTDGNDLFDTDPNEWSDNDLDGIGDVADTDDDNDGWSDVEENRAGTDSFSSSDQPIEGFEVLIPGTSITLGAWDLIGMFGGIPLFIWISFGFITRNTRSLKFENRMKEAKNLDELNKISAKVELSLTVRLLGVNQGIQLDKLRTEIKESFESAEADLEVDEVKNIPIISQTVSKPSQSAPADQIDESGYEWFTHVDGSKWYRAVGSEADWTKHE